MKKILVKLTVLVTLFFTGCKTTEFIPETETITRNIGDITITMRYISEAETVEKFGTNHNPYYRYPSKLPRRQFFVFETSIVTEESDLSINMRDITISLDGGNQSKARSVSTLDIDWKPYYKTDSEQARKKANMRKTMSGNSIEVTPDQPYNSWIVFLPAISKTSLQSMVKAPVDGPADILIRIPATTAAGDEGVIEIPMNLSAITAGVDDEENLPRNTGIFSEDADGEVTE